MEINRLVDYAFDHAVNFGFKVNEKGHLQKQQGRVDCVFGDAENLGLKSSQEKEHNHLVADAFFVNFGLKSTQKDQRHVVAEACCDVTLCFPHFLDCYNLAVVTFHLSRSSLWMTSSLS